MGDRIPPIADHTVQQYDRLKTAQYDSLERKVYKLVALCR